MLKKVEIDKNVADAKMRFFVQITPDFKNEIGQVVDTLTRQANCEEIY